MILSLIRERFPEHAVLGEEGGVSGPADSDYLWLGIESFSFNPPDVFLAAGV